MVKMNWKGLNVLVTGGASFIGSHLVDSLHRLGSNVRVADDFSSGKLDNLEYEFTAPDSGVWRTDNLSVHRGNLKERNFTASVMSDIDVVFHLAAKHGGRGYIDTHPVECCTNMLLDQMVFEEAWRADVERICFASSACVYPTPLQKTVGSDYLLTETDADPFVEGKAFPDLEYGYAKFMAEMTLKAYHNQYGVKTSSLRIFSSYGPRENETHAVVALIAKAMIKQDPYEIWSTGKQERNFTYVQDIADAFLHVPGKIEDGSPVNAGRDDRISLNETAELIFQYMNWRPKSIKHDISKPMGVATRAADLALAEKLLDWRPKVGYKEGLAKTIDWYLSQNNSTNVRKNIERLLFEVS